MPSTGPNAGRRSVLHAAGWGFRVRALLSLVLLTAFGCSDRSHERVVVYCAHDREFADEVLQEFSRRSGLQVVPRYDTEANKAVGLYEDLVREASRPRCDVHWNNEILATLRLAEQGIYESYDSPSAAPYPACHRSADRTWTAFAARARVLLINTDLVKAEERPNTLKELSEPRWRNRIVMAKPQFGTTATHVACLVHAWGEDGARAFFEKLHDNNIRILPGNKQVAVAVGQGNYAIGLTDTDDAVAELAVGRPVAMILPDGEEGTLFIPNTIALVRNNPNPQGARRLIDYLLSPEVERMLANSKSRQIPLNPEVPGPFPPEVEQARAVRPMVVDFAEAARLWPHALKLTISVLR